MKFLSIKKINSSIFKESFLYVFGEIFARMVQFFMLPYVSRKMSVTDYGELAYYGTFSSIFYIIVSFNQEWGIARYYYYYGKNSLNLPIRMGRLYAVFISAIFLTISYILQNEILAYLVIAGLFNLFISVELAILQSQKKALNYTMIQLISVATTTLSTIFVLEIFKDDLVEKRLIGTMVANLLVFLSIYFFPSTARPKRNFSLKQYKKIALYLFALGAPLIFHSISGFLKGQLDRIFINNIFSKHDLGLYAMGINFSLILTMLIISVNKSVIPYYFEALKKKKITSKKVQQFFFYSLLFIPIPAFISWIFPEDIFLWIISNKYVGVKYYATLFFIVSGIKVSYLILSNYLFYYGKNKMITFSSLLSAGIYIAVLLILVFFVKKMAYIPLASIIGDLSILPILYFMTKKTAKEVEN